MLKIRVPRLGFVEAWRHGARHLLRRGVPPDAVEWTAAGIEDDLFHETDLQHGHSGSPAKAPSVPSSFLPLAEAALCHSGSMRFSLPYRLLWRLQSDRSILADRSDPDVALLHAMEKSVRRDAHKMKAFVRFRDTGSSETGRRRFVAWFEPEHHIVERTAPFFARRFADMDWRIATPGYAASFENGRLDVRCSDERPDLPEDTADDLWRIYYANIFNPARLKVKAMKSEMPVKYWRNLPEAREIPALIANAEKSVQAMRAAMPTVPPARAERILSRLAVSGRSDAVFAPTTLDAAREAASHCIRCDLCKYATQTVFGEGAPAADVMFVGEQPGDIEDLTGRPFVGPAGRVFDEALGEAAVDRNRTYVTNAVKHFKFEPRGKLRLHKRPDAGEVRHCRWWLDLERELVKPRIIVALGATAALAVTGDGSDILKRRGGIEVAEDGLTRVFLTIHPSAILRAGDPPRQGSMRQAFVNDLKDLAHIIAGSSEPGGRSAP